MAEVTAPAPCEVWDNGGWVCEDHRDRPWQGDRACGCGGAGAPCPACNEAFGHPRVTDAIEEIEADADERDIRRKSPGLSAGAAQREESHMKAENFTQIDC